MGAKQHGRKRRLELTRHPEQRRRLQRPLQTARSISSSLLKGWTVEVTSDYGELVVVGEKSDEGGRDREGRNEETEVSRERESYSVTFD